MKFFQHRVRLVGSMNADINAGGEGTIAPGENETHDLGTLLKLCKQGAEFVHHFKIDDIDWRIGEDHPRNGGLRRNHEAGVGGGHSSSVCQLFSISVQSASGKAQLFAN